MQCYTIAVFISIKCDLLHYGVTTRNEVFSSYPSFVALTKPLYNVEHKFYIVTEHSVTEGDFRLCLTIDDDDDATICGTSQT